MPGIKTLKRPTGNAYHEFASHQPGSIYAWKPSKKQTKLMKKLAKKPQPGR